MKTDRNPRRPAKVLLAKMVAVALLLLPVATGSGADYAK